MKRVYTPPGVIISKPKPTKQAIHLSEIKDGIALERTFKAVVNDDKALLRHVRLGQRTLRVMKIIPTWHAFMQSDYYRTMQRALTSSELRRYRAAWELVFTVAEPPDALPPLRLAMHYMIRAAMRKNYGKELRVNPGQFGIDEERAAVIAEAAEKAYGEMYPNGSPDIALAMSKPGA